jgi:hypothetical protein
MDIVSLLIQLVSGAVGGNLAGTLLKNFNLGTAGNTLAGIIGGGLGGQILERGMGIGHLAAAAPGGLDVGTIVSQIAGGGVGGGVLMVIVGLLRRLFTK